MRTATHAELRPFYKTYPQRSYPQPTPPCKSYPKNARLKMLPRGARRHGRRIPPLAHTRHLANPIQQHERFEHAIPRTSACKSYPINARFENVIPHTPACKSYPKMTALSMLSRRRPFANLIQKMPALNLLFRMRPLANLIKICHTNVTCLSQNAMPLHLNPKLMLANLI